MRNDEMNEVSVARGTPSMREARSLGSRASERTALRRWELSAIEWLRSVGYPRPLSTNNDDATAEIGVVGLSGMGKSTLLNALLTPGVQLLPAGGVSPLTGLAVRILHDDETALRVEYVDRTWLHDVLRALKAERLLEADRARLSLACTGDQYGIRDPEWLSAAIQHALSPDSKRPPDEQHTTLTSLRTLSAAFEYLGKRRVWLRSSDASSFFTAVRDHTAGQLAPLCKDAELSVTAPLLRTGVTLVDLPGVGAIGDSHSSVTHAFLRRANAVMLVVDRAGLSDSVLEALQRSGFVERWIDGQAEWLIAVTKLDLVADDARRGDRCRYDWNRYFIETAAAVRSLLHAQVITALNRLGFSALARLPQIVPVSSDEMHRQAMRDQEAPPRLRNTATTGIPELRRALAATARLAAAKWTRDVGQTIASALGDDAHSEWLALLEQEGNK